MSFAGKVWRLLVGVKDALALLFLLLFFIALYMVLTARPSPGQVRDGALLLKLEGSVVEEAAQADPLNLILSQQLPAQEYQARDLVQAIDAAAIDPRIKVIALDLSRFVGGGQVHLSEIGAALDRARAAKKPVLAFANAYADDGLMLAAHASEVWLDPMGGAVVAGPGGDQLYYAGLIERLKVNAHIFRVGTYKSAIEPFTRSDMSPEARNDASALYSALWEEWKADVKKARPAANLTLITTQPVEWLASARGDSALAAKQAGLVDHLGTRVAFGNRVAKIAGPDKWDMTPGAFAHTEMEPLLAAHKPAKTGKTIGVITIAGEIVDGEAGPGKAGGDRIAALLDDALQDDLAGLVVRVDSPGGSVTASEEIRRAILRHKARKIPVAVSMGNVAASGGYWVSTPAERIFAAPETVTGSIGIFAVVPTFENVLSQWGVTTDGVKTTPLSGQPNLAAGLTPETQSMVQSVIENGYARFLTLVSRSRGKTPAEVNDIAQGRVWAGGPARQIGLVDQFGGLDDAVAWAAKRARLKDGEWHVKYIGSQPDTYHSLLQMLVSSGGAEARAPSNDLVSLLTLQQTSMSQQLVRDMRRLLGTQGAEAYCLSCPRPVRGAVSNNDSMMFQNLATLLRD